jgi:hypothetical protein
MNGNRWVGTGHHAVITDEAGQDWALTTPSIAPTPTSRRPIPTSATARREWLRFPTQDADLFAGTTARR